MVSLTLKPMPSMKKRWRAPGRSSRARRGRACAAGPAPRAGRRGARVPTRSMLPGPLYAGDGRRVGLDARCDLRPARAPSCRGRRPRPRRPCARRRDPSRVSDGGDAVEVVGVVDADAELEQPTSGECGHDAAARRRRRWRTSAVAGRRASGSARTPRSSRGRGDVGHADGDRGESVQGHGAVPSGQDGRRRSDGGSRCPRCGSRRRRRP